MFVDTAEHANRRVDSATTPMVYEAHGAAMARSRWDRWQIANVVRVNALTWPTRWFAYRSGAENGAVMRVEPTILHRTIIAQHHRNSAEKSAERAMVCGLYLLLAFLAVCCVSRTMALNVGGLI